MKILLLSDVESPYLWDYYQPGRLNGYSLMLSCGDLKASYLSFLVTMGRARLLYVHGNHDTGYDRNPPEGCECIDDKLVVVNGLRILGLGGSLAYNGGKHQYTEQQMRMRIWKAGWAVRRAGGVDIVLTHAPPRGVGDAGDLAHMGFEAFLPFLDKYRPKYLVHGHVHMNYGRNIPRCIEYGQTKVINAWERYVLEI